MQPKWLVIARGRELGEFASRYAATVFAEHLSLVDGPYSILRRPLGNSESPPMKASLARPNLLRNDIRGNTYRLEIAAIPRDY